MRNAADEIFQATIIFCLENRERSFILTRNGQLPTFNAPRSARARTLNNGNQRRHRKHCFVQSSEASGGALSPDLLGGEACRYKAMAALRLKRQTDARSARVAGCRSFLSMSTSAILTINVPSSARAAGTRIRIATH